MALKRTRPRVDDIVISTADQRWYVVREVVEGTRGWKYAVCESLDTYHTVVFAGGEFTIHHHAR